MSDWTDEARTVENINEEIKKALDILDIDTCILLVHSISGVYGLDFVATYPEKVEGFIAIDNTVYDEELSESLKMEGDYMLQVAEEFDSLRNTFGSIEDFENAIIENPENYGAELPAITEYKYSEADQAEYYKAYSRSLNKTIQSEILCMSQALETIKGKKFPSPLPVLTMIASENVAAMPVWKTAHEAQLDFSSGKHELYVVKGNHYIWYSNLSSVAHYILEWNSTIKKVCDELKVSFMD